MRKTVQDILSKYRAQFSVLTKAMVLERSKEKLKTQVRHTHHRVSMMGVHIVVGGL